MLGYLLLVLALCEFDIGEARRTYVGCFKDHRDHTKNKRAMPHRAGMIIFQHDLCEQVCLKNDYSFMATTHVTGKLPWQHTGNSDQFCFCGNAGDHERYGPADESNCQVELTRKAYTTDFLAKRGYIRVYSIERDFTLTGETLFACAKDKKGAPSRLMPGTDLFKFSWNSHLLCASFCRMRGFDLMGLRNAKWCFCSKEDDFPADYERKTNCDKKCGEGNTRETCGHKKSLEVYKITSEPLNPPPPAPGPVDTQEDQREAARELIDSSDSRIGRVDSRSDENSVNSTYYQGSNILVLPKAVMNIRVRFSGDLIGWKVLAMNTNPLHLAVFRKVGTSGTTYSYIGGTDYTATEDQLGVFNIVLSPSEYIAVEVDDEIGFWWGGDEAPITFREQIGPQCNARSHLLTLDNESAPSYSAGDEKTFTPDTSTCAMFNVQAFIKRN